MKRKKEEEADPIIKKLSKKGQFSEEDYEDGYKFFMKRGTVDIYKRVFEILHTGDLNKLFDFENDVIEGNSFGTGNYDAPQYHESDTFAEVGVETMQDYKAFVNIWKHYYEKLKPTKDVKEFGDLIDKIKEKNLCDLFETDDSKMMQEFCSKKNPSDDDCEKVYKAILNLKFIDRKEIAPMKQILIAMHDKNMKELEKLFVKYNNNHKISIYTFEEIVDGSYGKEALKKISEHYFKELNPSNSKKTDPYTQIVNEFNHIFTSPEYEKALKKRMSEYSQSMRKWVEICDKQINAGEHSENDFDSSNFNEKFWTEAFDQLDEKKLLADDKKYGKNDQCLTPVWNLLKADRNPNTTDKEIEELFDKVKEKCPGQWATENGDFVWGVKDDWRADPFGKMKNETILSSELYRYGFSIIICASKLIMAMYHGWSDSKFKDEVRKNAVKRTMVKDHKKKQK